CIALRVASVVLAHPCNICPIVFCSPLAIHLHHYNMGLNTYFQKCHAQNCAENSLRNIRFVYPAVFSFGYGSYARLA
ncbi:MAG: hypothetical protein FWC70_08900, partial [Defluviitaleaceae bacterium]|nr:hypothetical protein [Defluviitaleaceae bacterium]